MSRKSVSKICSQGKVLSSEGALARVEVSRSAMCDGCSQQGSCNITTLEPGRDTVAVVRNPVGAVPGDTVEVSIDESVLVRGSMILYILPLVFMMGAILLALWIKGKADIGLGDDVLALLAALAGLVLSIPMVRIWSNRSRYMAENIPVITKILPRGEDEEKDCCTH